MSGSSQFTRAPNLNEFTSDYVQLQAGRRVYPDPNGVFYPMGNLYSITAPAALATGTSEQTLATFSLPANALDQVGRIIRIRAGFVTTNNAHAKTCKIYFGTTALSTGSVTTALATPWLEMYVTRGLDTGAAVQMITGGGIGGTDGLTNVSIATEASDDMTAAIVIKATGQTGTSGAADIVLVGFFVQYMN